LRHSVVGLLLLVTGCMIPKKYNCNELPS